MTSNRPFDRCPETYVLLRCLLSSSCCLFFFWFLLLLRPGPRGPGSAPQMAPEWIMGPSLPQGSPAPTEKMTPTSRRVAGWLPFVLSISRFWEGRGGGPLNILQRKSPPAVRLRAFAGWLGRAGSGSGWVTHSPRPRTAATGAFPCALPTGAPDGLGGQSLEVQQARQVDASDRAGHSLPWSAKTKRKPRASGNFPVEPEGQ